jgi:hypothetical protein
MMTKTRIAASTAAFAATIGLAGLGDSRRAQRCQLPIVGPQGTARLRSGVSESLQHANTLPVDAGQRKRVQKPSSVSSNLTEGTETSGLGEI